MKQIFWFKRIVETMYILHIAGLIAICVIVPFGEFNVGEDVVKLNDYTSFHWGVLMVFLLSYLILLRGLHFLQTTAKHLVHDKGLSNVVVKHLKASGVHFVMSGICVLILLTTVWVKGIMVGSISLAISNVFYPLLLLITGSFFIIQSETLSFAKGIRDENNLTI